MRQRVRQMPLNAGTFRALMPSAARSAQTPPVEIDGVIEMLEPGGFPGVPDVAPHGPVTRIVTPPTLRGCARRKREPLGWAWSSRQARLRAALVLTSDLDGTIASGTTEAGWMSNSQARRSRVCRRWHGPHLLAR